MTTILATNPTMDGIKESIARYWYTTTDQIIIKDELIFQTGDLMPGCMVLPHRGGFKFVDIRT